MGQLLRYSLSVSRRKKGQSIDEFMVTDFIDAVRKCLKDGGYARKKDEEELAGTFLVGYAGRLFKIMGDYQVSEAILPFDACGCGEDYALGAMHAYLKLLRGADCSPETVLRYGLTAAEEFSAGVRGPFNFVVLGKPNE
jgi:ATP-dependent protease HslVU (ClpYQ) peptidase subunit